MLKRELPIFLVVRNSAFILLRAKNNLLKNIQIKKRFYFWLKCQNMSLPDLKKPHKVKENFPVVGIGASAGGLDAFKKILKGIPQNSGMAYVIVQHLSPDYPSNLPLILSQSTELPVHGVVNDVTLEPDHIYI